MSLSWFSMPSFAAALIFLLGCFTFKGSESAFAFPEHADPASSSNSFRSVSEIEDYIKGMIFRSLEAIAPELLSHVTTVSINPQCDKAIFKFVRGVIEMHGWAFKMLDATGKPSAGLLEGTGTFLGDYDECLNVEMPLNTDNHSRPVTPADVIRGQYCMLKIDFPNALKKDAMDYQAGNKSTSYLANTKTFLKNFVKIAPRADIAALRLGICIPFTCDIGDVEEIVSKLTGGSSMVTVLRCETKEDKELEVQQITIMAVLGFIASLVLCGTLIDTILRTMASGPVDDVFFKKQNLYIQCLVAFSLGNNFRKLSKLESEDGQLTCVRGIKFLSVCLIIFVTTYIMPIDLQFIKYRSAFNIYKFLDQWWFSIVANSAAGVDTLFFLAGLQITYKLWRKAAAGPDEKMVSINIIKFLVVWYSRLTASQLLVIALFLLFPVIGSGPLWADVVIPEVEHCKATWWMNVLCINNFWPANETCLYHTWLVTSLMHLLLVTPLILWILNRWSIIGIILTLTLILGSCIAVAVVTVASELPPSSSLYFISFLNFRRTWDKMFIQAYGHLAPFCIGILTGYLLVRNPKIELRKLTAIIGWSAASAGMLSVIFGLYRYRHGEAIEPPTLSTFYAAAHRLAWAVSIAWIVASCAYGYGGAINEFLSWKVFIPFDRLSNLIYLLHPLVIFFHSGQVRENLHMAHLDQVVYSFAYIFLTCLLAAFCYVIFVVPYRFLESMIWKPRGERDKGTQHHRVSKVIAIKERITNDLDITMRDTPGRFIIDNHAAGIDNSAFSA